MVLLWGKIIIFLAENGPVRQVLAIFCASFVWQRLDKFVFYAKFKDHDQAAERRSWLSQ